MIPGTITCAGVDARPRSHGHAHAGTSDVDRRLRHAAAERAAAHDQVQPRLLMDGKSEPARINVGKANAHPPHWHFKLCP